MLPADQSLEAGYSFSDQRPYRLVVYTQLSALECLPQLGFKLQPAAQEAHLCCGSAGTYSVLQPALSTQLRERKLGHLLGESASERPAAVLSANIGCITHLQAGTEVPVRHWVELLDEALIASK